MRISEAAKEYLNLCIANQLAQTTMKRYNEHFNRLVLHLNDCNLESINRQILEGYKLQRLRAGAAPSTIKGEIMILLASMRHTDDMEMTHIGDATIYTLRKATRMRINNTRCNVLPLDVAEDIIKELPPHLKVAVWIALLTGLRRSDIAKLRWEDIDLDRGIIRLITRKTKKRINMPISKKLIQILAAWKTIQKRKNEWVFPAPKNPKYKREHSQLSMHRVREALKKHGYEDFTFHDLRHTFATYFLQATGDIKALQELLGHSSIMMTMRYSHVLTSHKTKLIEIYSDVIDNLLQESREAKERHEAAVAENNCDVKINLTYLNGRQKWDAIMDILQKQIA